MRRCLHVLISLCVGLGIAFSQTSIESPRDAVIQANNDFALSFAKEAYRQAPRENVLTSPAALSYAFGLLLNGTSKTAGKEIADTFHLNEVPLSDINAGNADLKRFRTARYITPAKFKTLPQWDQAKFDADHWTHVPYSVSGALWARRGVFPPRFLVVSRDSYGFIANIEKPSPVAVNAWATRANRGKAVPLVSASRSHPDFEVTMLTRFNTKWDHEFVESKTHPGDFKLLSGDIKTVPLMQQDGKYDYFETDRFQAIEVEFVDGKMLVVLPKSESALGELMGTLSPASWKEWKKQFRSLPGHLELPRFEVAQSGNVVPVLQSMGVRTIFSDLGALKPLVGPLGGKLTGVLVGSSMKLNEKGVELVSFVDIRGVIGGICSGCQPPPPFRMIVDHPFFFAITDRLGEVIYAGTIVEP